MILDFLRSLLLGLAYVMVTTLLSVWGALTCHTEARALAIGQAWGRILLRIARIAGIKIALRGEALPRAGAALIASRHESALDTMLFMAILPRPTFILKQELIGLPLFGPLLARAGMIPIDRAAGARALRAAIAGALRAKQDQRQIIIFPEGTRLASGQVAPLQSGVAAIAAALDLPVIPVRLDSGRLWPRHGFRRHAGTLTVTIGTALAPNLPRAQIMAALATALDPGADPAEKGVA